MPDVRPAPAATVRAGGHGVVPAANSFAPAADRTDAGCAPRTRGYGPRRRTWRCPSREFIRPGGGSDGWPPRTRGHGPRRRTWRCPSREFIRPGRRRDEPDEDAPHRPNRPDDRATGNEREQEGRMIRALPEVEAPARIPPTGGAHLIHR